MSDSIAIIGTGNVGSALGGRLVASGFKVTFGARDPKTTEVPKGAEVATVADALRRADVVFLAVPGGAAIDALRPGGELRGKVIVDCTNRVAMTPEGPVLPKGETNAEAIAHAFPGADVLKGFNTFGAEFHEDPRIDGKAADVYLAGSDAAKARVSAIARKAGFEPIDCGPLRNATLLENLAILWIHLAMKGGQGRGIAFKLLRR
jgi:predicted dinucleotide-binding enzyme